MVEDGVIRLTLQLSFSTGTPYFSRHGSNLDVVTPPPPLHPATPGRDYACVCTRTNIHPVFVSQSGGVCSARNARRKNTAWVCKHGRWVVHCKRCLVVAYIVNSLSVQNVAHLQGGTVSAVWFCQFPWFDSHLYYCDFVFISACSLFWPQLSDVNTHPSYLITVLCASICLKVINTQYMCCVGSWAVRGAMVKWVTIGMNYNINQDRSKGNPSVDGRQKGQIPLPSYRLSWALQSLIEVEMPIKLSSSLLVWKHSFKSQRRRVQSQRCQSNTEAWRAAWGAKRPTAWEWQPCGCLDELTKGRRD